MLTFGHGSVFFDDSKYSTWDRVAEYVGFSGGLIPFVLAFFIVRSPSRVSLLLKIATNATACVCGIILLACCVSPVFGFVVGLIAYLWGLSIGSSLRNMQGVNEPTLKQ